jgi:hypothetical protein
MCCHRHYVFQDTEITSEVQILFPLLAKCNADDTVETALAARSSGRKIIGREMAVG